MVRYLFYTIGDLTYQSPLVNYITLNIKPLIRQFKQLLHSEPVLFKLDDVFFASHSRHSKLIFLERFSIKIPILH